MKKLMFFVVIELIFLMFGILVGCLSGAQIGDISMAPFVSTSVLVGFAIMPVFTLYDF